LTKKYSLAFLNSGAGVVDVAGGIGDLALCLALLGVKATVVDPRPTVGCLSTKRRKAAAKAIKQDCGENIVPYSVAQAWFGAAPGNDLAAANRDLEDKFTKYKTGERTMGSVLEYGDKFPFRRVPAAEGEEVAIGDGIPLPYVMNAAHPLLRECSLITGLHPDGATDFVPRLAERNGRPFAVVPCCVFGEAHPHRVLPGEMRGDVDGTWRKVSSREDLIKWLELGLDRVQREEGGGRADEGGDAEPRRRDILNFAGANVAVYVLPKERGVRVELAAA
jgi:hypothetical protein